MQRVRGLASLNNSLSNTLVGVLSTCHKSFSAQPNCAHSNDLQDQVLVEGRAKCRGAVLNRPSSLNALTAPMVSHLTKLYESWEENSDIVFAYMKGSGGAFCSGADAISLCQLVNEGRDEECKKFFETLYKFVYLQATYLKPHVAMLDGTISGCGAGISIPGMFRVVSDRTVFSHPEAQMGFHPDAGASYYLSRLPGYMGEYLALTGCKLNGVEMIALELATHYAPNARHSLIEERLSTLITADATVIRNTLAQYSDPVHPDMTSVLFRMAEVNKCFSRDTVEEIVDALENEAAKSSDAWCKAALANIKAASPLSLKVTLRSIRESRFQTVDQCLSREYRISLVGISKMVSNDFSEGVRAHLVDKDFPPKWDPPSLGEVSGDMVDSYFTQRCEPELELPTATREPYV